MAKIVQTVATQKFIHKNCGGELKMVKIVNENGREKMMVVCQKCGAIARRIKDLKA